MSSAPSACGLTVKQKEAVQRFGLATTQIGSFVSSELPKLRQSTIKMNVARLTIGGDGNKDKLDGPLTPDRIKTRIVAADALST